MSIVVEEDKGPDEAARRGRGPAKDGEADDDELDDITHYMPNDQVGGLCLQEVREQAVRESRW